MDQIQVAWDIVIDICVYLDWEMYAPSENVGTKLKGTGNNVIILYEIVHKEMRGETKQSDS